MIVRLFCGVALVGLSLVVYLHLAWVPLCVSHHERIRPCPIEESCPVYLVDFIDVRCTKALTLWAVDRPGPMWEMWWEADDNMLNMTLITDRLLDSHSSDPSPDSIRERERESWPPGELIFLVSPHVDRENLLITTGD